MRRRRSRKNNRRNRRSRQRRSRITESDIRGMIREELSMLNEYPDSPNPVKIKPYKKDVDEHDVDGMASVSGGRKLERLTYDFDSYEDLENFERLVMQTYPK